MEALYYHNKKKMELLQNTSFATAPIHLQQFLSKKSQIGNNMHLCRGFVYTKNTF